MKKKVLAVVLVLSLILCGLTGCHSADSSVPSSSNQETSGQAAGESFNETGYPIVNEPLTLKVMFAIRDTDVLTEPDTMPVIRALEEKTGIHLEWEVVKSSDWSTKLNLMWASGEYPDILLHPSGAVEKEEFGVEQHLLIPLEEMIEQYMPVYTERIAGEDEDPTTSLIASDGHTYSIGYLFAQDISVEQHFFINQEWLDALNLKTPETMDELTDTLRAFKNGDPNGNGQPDEVPLQMGLNAAGYGIRWLLPMFGIPLDSGSRWIYIDDDKNVQLAPVQDGFRQCMEWLHVLYEEGLTDPEFISQDKNTVDTKLKSDNVGMFVCWRLEAMGYSDGVEKNATLFVPPSPEGTKVSCYRYLETASPGASITCTNEHVPESLRLLDAMLETETMFSLYFGAEGSGAEGKGWEYDNNGMINVTNDNTADVKDYLDCNALFFAPGNYISSTYNLPSQRIEKIEYCDIYEEAGIVQKYSDKYLNYVPLTAEQRDSTQLIATDIDNAVWENAANFVSKGVTDESWDAFVKLFADMGVEEKYVQVYQGALDQMKLD